MSIRFTSFIDEARKFNDVFRAVLENKTISTIYHLGNFSLGFVGLYGVLKTCALKSRDISQAYDILPHWQKKACEIADFLGDISFIVKGTQSIPTIITWSWRAHALSSTAQFVNFFICKELITGVANNRHLSYLAFILGIPSTIKTTFTLYTWAFSSLKHQKFSLLRIQDFIITTQTTLEIFRDFLNSTPKNWSLD